MKFDDIQFERIIGTLPKTIEKLTLPAAADENFTNWGDAGFLWAQVIKEVATQV